MKKIMLFLATVLMLVACGGNAEDVEDDAEVDDNSEEESERSVEIEVNKEVAFLDFKAEIKEVELYEEGESLLIDIPIKWLNLTEDKKMLMQVTGMDVKQGDKLLNEVNDAWLSNEGEVRNKNASRGEWTADLTYELDNGSNSVEVTFVPRSEHDDSETIKIDIE